MSASSASPRWLRVALALALLALVAWYANPRALLASLRSVSPPWFAAALAVAVASNVTSALRWARIARALDLVAPDGALVASYARGLAANTVLPGAVLGGDVLRSYELHRLGNPLASSAFSVMLDRLSGLWVLCAMSLAAGASLALADLLRWTHAPVSAEKLAPGLLVLALATALPFWNVSPEAVGRLPMPGADSLASKWAKVHGALARLRPSWPSLLAISVAVQALSAAALWLYGRAAGLELSFLTMLAAAAPIFVMAALPVSHAGFGTRELAAVFVLGLAGVAPQGAAATGLLYGIGAMIQGMLGAPLFLQPRQQG